MMNQAMKIAMAVAKKAKMKKMAQGGWVESEPMEKNSHIASAEGNYEESEPLQDDPMNDAAEENYDEPEYFAEGGMVGCGYADGGMVQDDMPSMSYPADLEEEKQVARGGGYFSSPLKDASEGDMDRKKFLSSLMAHRALRRGMKKRG